MVFSSIIFVFRFLPIFMIVYFLAGFCPYSGRVKNMILFLGSLIFYAWGEPVYVLLMLFSTVWDYIHGLGISICRKKWSARLLLLSSVGVNLLILGFFKYADLLIKTINLVAGTDFALLELSLPIGISFYTFQSMSYIIDVYRKKAKAQKNFLDFAVYVTMFPQLIAGPIVKYRDVEDQLHERKTDVESISYGCRRFVCGLAKKVLLANNIGLLWEEVSAMEFGNLSTVTAWLGIVAFAMQIYFDFSGYSDMAIGLGAILGFHFPENFKYPYISTSVADFWRRWHISLGSWFKEYVYYPLGGSREGILRTVRNILIVWMLTGIWHGASWSFLLWGVWFAFFLILEKLGLRVLLDHLPKMFGRAYTMAVIIFGWVLFALDQMEDVLAYLRAMVGMNGLGVWDSSARYLAREYAVLLVVCVIGATPLFKGIGGALERSGSGLAIAFKRLVYKVVPALLLLASVAYIMEASYNPFLYFRF